MRKLKNLRDSSQIIFSKYTQKIPLCCNIFFHYVQSSIRSTIPEYAEAPIQDHEEGILFCPECLIKRLKN